MVVTTLHHTTLRAAQGRTEVLLAKITLPMAMVGTGNMLRKEHHKYDESTINPTNQTFGNQDATQRIDQRDVYATEITAHFRPSEDCNTMTAEKIGAMHAQLQRISAAFHHADF